jgi:hypothetical protein
VTVTRRSLTPQNNQRSANPGYDTLAVENTASSDSREKQGQTPLCHEACGKTFRPESQWKLIILWWTHWGAYPENSSQEVISPRWRKEEQWEKEETMEEDADAMGLVTGERESPRTLARA